MSPDGSKNNDNGTTTPDALYRSVQSNETNQEEAADATTHQSSSKPSSLLSTTAACLAILKGNIGPGILNLPRAFALTGYGLGSILFVGIAAQGIYSMWLLVECHNCIVAAPGPRRRRLTFMAVAQSALGKTGGRVVEVFLFVLQGGVCCVFLSLISTNLNAAIPTLSNIHAILIVSVYMGITAMLRNIQDLFYLNMIANTFMLLAIATAIVAGLSHAEHAVFAKSGGISNIVLFTSDLFFAFEGIGLVLPIENAYDHSENTFSFSFVLLQSMALVALAFGLTGVAGSIGFDVKTGSITAFLHEEYPNVLWYSIVNVLVIVAVAMTFPLQLTPAAQVLEAWLDASRNGGSDFDDLGTSESSTTPIHTALSTTEDAGVEQTSSQPSISLTRPAPLASSNDEMLAAPRTNYTWLFQRWAMVAIFTILVLTVNDLSLLMGLFGAVGQTGLAGMPCAIHLALQYQGRAPRCFWMSALDVLILLLTTIVMIAGCSVSLQQIVTAL